MACRQNGNIAFNILSLRVHIYSSEHSDLSVVSRFMSLLYVFGTLTIDFIPTLYISLSYLIGFMG